MIRVGLVGVGDPRHRLFLAALDRRRAGVRIVGVSEPDPILREEFARQYDLPAWTDHRALLAEAGPSLVAVAGPDSGQIVIEALRSAADVLVAPPICTTIDELDLISRLVSGTDRRVTAVYTYRAHPAARTAKELIDSGRLGRPELVTMIIGPDHSDPDQREALGEAIDLFGWLTGVRADTVQSTADDPEDARAFGELILTIAGSDETRQAELEIRRRPDVAESSTIIQVAGSDGAVEWDVASGLLRSVINGRDPVTVSCGPFTQPPDWVLNNLLRKPRPVVSTEETLATARMWLEVAGAQRCET